MNELKPCPFCDGCGSVKLDPEGTKDSAGRKWAYTVSCDKCCASTGVCWNREMAIELWNRRANEPEITEQGIIHGHWIGQPISGYADCKCSVCGAICNVHACAGIPTQKYCYRCGALMLEDKRCRDI